MPRLANTIGFDDAPFDTEERVPVVGAVFASARFDGMVVGDVRRDGFDAADRLSRLVRTSKFDEHVQLILLQGITLAGFNVVDVFRLHDLVQRPVLIVTRRAPDYAAVRNALLHHPIPDGPAKWDVIDRLGPVEPLGRVFVQRIGLTRDEAAAVLDRLAVHSHVPEPLRTAHLVAGALAEGVSRGRP